MAGQDAAPLYHCMRKLKIKTVITGDKFRKMK